MMKNVKVRVTARKGLSLPLIQRYFTYHLLVSRILQCYLLFTHVSYKFCHYASFRKTNDVPICLIFFQSGSDRRHFQKTVATQVVRRKTTGLPSERRTLEPDRKRASTCSPEAKIAERRDNEKSVIKNESLPLDAEEIYEVDYLDIGDDGQEEICHKCGLDGDLTCCDRCPISMHLKCIEVLGLRVPKSNEDWCCPICVAVKASQGAREAAKVSILMC